MFPSTGIRGALRRRARDLVRNAAIAATGNETPFTLDEHYFLTLGGIKGEGAQERSTVAMEEEWRRKNPLLSPASYTYIDVYKRQSLRNCQRVVFEASKTATQKRRRTNT